MTPPSRILVPIDGSSNSARALDIAIMLTRTYGAELVILNVIPAPSALIETPVGLGFPTTSMGEYYDREEKTSSNFIDEAMSICKKQGISNVDTEVVRASKSIVAEIIDLAAKRKIDLIVIGTRGVGGFRKLLLGSVSSGVVTHAHCNVLVVR